MPYYEATNWRNCTQLKVLIDTLTSYGTTYNPMNPQITITALEALYNQAYQAATDRKNGNYAARTNKAIRKNDFKDLKKLSTRLKNQLKALRVPTEIQQIANSIHRKIHGRRAKPIPNTPTTPSPDMATPDNATNTDQNTPPTQPPAPKKNSPAQQSFDSLTEHLMSYISLLQTIPNYDSNQNELKITNLNTRLNNYLAITSEVTKSEAYEAATIDLRDYLYYHPTQGIYNITLEVKSEIRTQYPVGSNRYKQIHRIKFTKKPYKPTTEGNTPPSLPPPPAIIAPLAAKSKKK